MDNQYVLLTGTSGGIGSQVLKYIESKYKKKILVLSSSIDSSEEDQGIKYIRFDASSLEDVKLISERLISQYEISHFIQVHGSATASDSFEESSEESLFFNMNVNCFSTILLLKVVLRSMRKNDFGRIVLMNTASSCHGGGRKSFGYGLSKHSMTYIVQHIAKYYASSNILANCISPGFVDTSFHANIMHRTREVIHERILGLPLKRACSSKEVATMMCRLAFENDYITGQNIVMDGADFI